MGHLPLSREPAEILEKNELDSEPQVNVCCIPIIKFSSKLKPSR